MDGRIQNLAMGNTEIAAGLVQMLTQADIFRIEQVREYSPTTAGASTRPGRTCTTVSGRS